MVCLLWKTVWWLLTKLNIFFLCDSEIMLFDIYPSELKTYVYMKTCTQMSTAILLIIAKFWKQARCPSTGEWINKLWYIQTMEYYLSLKINVLASHNKIWRNLKCILLSESSQIEKAICCMISVI